MHQPLMSMDGVAGNQSIHCWGSSMKSDKLIRLALTGAILAALSPVVLAGEPVADPAGSASGAGGGAPQATAAPQRQTQDSKKETTLQTVVVTASATGVKKLEASYNIVTANREQIRDANPMSVADLMKISPGIWPESTGGQTGANIDVAGFPSTSDTPFFTNMVNGTPLYGMSSLAFMDSSSLFRLDDTISRVEIVQGGPGAIFGPGQPGATANFMLRQGTAKPSGDIAVTYGDEGMERVDGFYGFPIGKSGTWFGSIGGFYRVSDGIRDPQFKADKGGQLTATLSHDMDNGTFMLWARVVNDKNQFITNLPMVQGSGTSFSAFPGFDALTSDFASRALQYNTVPGPLGNMINGNLGTGRGTRMNYFGGSYDATFGSWTLSDHFLYDGGTLPIDSLWSNNNPKPLGYYLYGCNVAQSAGWCSASNKPVDGDNLGYPATRVVDATLPNGQVVPLDQSVIHQNWRVLNKRLKNLVNDFRISDEIFDGNTLTAGVYLARYTDHTSWSIGNQTLMLNQPNSQPIGLTYVQNGQTYVVSNPMGLLTSNNNNIQVGAATNKALYLSDSWTIGPWLLQAGGRVENINLRFRACSTSPVNLDGNPLTLYDNAVPLCNGTWDMESYNKTHPSYTLGANYTFNQNMSAYFRANSGVTFPNFDAFRGIHGNIPNVQKVRNMEVGFKYGSEHLFVDVSAYQRLFTGLGYTETDLSGHNLGHQSFYGANTHGLDLNATWSPIENLKFTLVGDYMKGHYSHHNACSPFIDVNGSTQCINFDGKPLARQPLVRYMFTPSYILPTSWGSVMAFLTYTHVGPRYQDQSGLQPLGTYNTLDGGVVADVGANWEFRLQGTNLTNEVALTEGNGRVFGVNTGVGGVLMARPLFGREVFVQARYKF